MTDRRWTSSLGGLLAGIVALVLVTAILSSALAARRTSDTVASLSHQLEAASAQRDQVRADLLTSQQQSAAALANLAAQNRRLQHKLDVLVRFLRANGLQVPKIVATTTASPAPPGTKPGVVRSHPKAPASRPPKAHPASPAPATPATTASPGTTDLTCNLAPALCPLLHP